MTQNIIIYCVDLIFFADDIKRFLKASSRKKNGKQLVSNLIGNNSPNSNLVTLNGVYHPPRRVCLQVLMDLKFIISTPTLQLCKHLLTTEQIVT